MELQGTFWRKNELDIFTRLKVEEVTDGGTDRARTIADLFQQSCEISTNSDKYFHLYTVITTLNVQMTKLN